MRPPNTNSATATRRTRGNIRDRKKPDDVSPVFLVLDRWPSFSDLVL
jgi:hypothetical protein